MDVGPKDSLLVAICAGREKSRRQSLDVSSRLIADNQNHHQSVSYCVIKSKCMLCVICIWSSSIRKLWTFR